MIEVDNVRKQGKTSALPSACPISLYTTSRDKVAFIQYRSGSTSEPKGVMITYGCIVHNVETILRFNKYPKSFFAPYVGYLIFTIWD